MKRNPRYLKLVLTGEIVESGSGTSFFTRRNRMKLHGLLEVLEKAGRTGSIRAVLLVVQRLSIGWAQVEELQEALEQVRRLGKSVAVYLVQADNKSYYLAAAADRVALPPAGTLEFVGLRSEGVYLKQLLSTLGIQAQLVAIGAFKSAGEMFTREDMSEESRRATAELLQDLHGRIVRKVASFRKVDFETVESWISGAPFSAPEAVTRGLVDDCCYEDEFERQLEDRYPGIKPLSGNQIRVGESFVKRWLTFRRPQIAWLAAEGIIVAGESHRARGRWPLLGSETLVQALRYLREKRRVKAIVLRIDSPGGSGLASDLLWREIKRTDEKKPVIVSFGNIAASGGYYIATGARAIFASPSSLTGSIGVIGGKFNAEGLLAKLGVSAAAVETGPRSGYTSPARPFSEAELELVHRQLEYFYEELFLKKVAQSRSCPVDEIRPLAEGRVWTGFQGRETHLVDQLGGLKSSLEFARREAGLEGRKVRIIQVERRRRLQDLFALPLLETLSRDRILCLAPWYPEIQ